MAALRLALLTALWSVLLASTYGLPTRRLLDRDGTSGEDTGAHSLPAEMDALPVAPRRWEWQATGGGAHDAPQGPRKKRQVGMAFPVTAAGKPTESFLVPQDATRVGMISKGKPAGPFPNVTAASNAHERTVSQDVITQAIAHLSTARSTRPPPAPASPFFSFKKGGTKDGVVTSAPQGSLEKATAAPSEMRNASSATENWPWLDVFSTSSSATLDNSSLSTANLSRGSAGAKGKSGSLHTTAVASTSTTEQPWLDEFSASSATLDNSSLSTANLSRGFSGAKGKSGSPHKAAVASTSTTEQPWLDEFSTSSATLDNSSLSTANLSRGLDSVGSALGRKVKEGFPLTTATAKGTPAQVRPPKAKPPGSTLVGQCLLAMLLLALVAGIFIVTSAVLGILLWRQKRAYRMNQQNHTEMVCISSLLAAEEAEEAARKGPQVKRVRMLGENGSEAEMDNLTLNSFLPEH